MKKTFAVLALAAVGITTASAGIRFGINFGIPVPAPVVVAPAPVVVAPAPVVPPPMPAPIVETLPVCPTAGYVWVGGSWGWCDNHWVWTRGHWGPPAHWDRNDHRDRDGHWGHGYRAERHEGFHGGHGRR